MIGCIILNKVTTRLGIPVLLAFIVLGMFFGSEGVVKIPFDDFMFAEQICSTCLIFIMFYGGFGTKWRHAKPVAIKAMLLSSFGVILTALITGLFCYCILHMNWLESFLIGSVISSTDAASVFYILRSKQLNLKYNTASLLEVESGSNDPWAYMLTVLVLAFMSGTQTKVGVVYLLFAQIFFGVLFGIIIALLALWVFKRFQFQTAGVGAVFVIAVALLSYSVPVLFGGNGYLSVYIVGIILGNNPIKNKEALVHFMDGITGLIQMLIFFLLGLLVFPSQLMDVFWTALLIALFLVLIARPIVVFTILAPFRCKRNQRLLISFSGLRGASSIVFAIIAAIHPINTSMDVFHIVFCIVLFSILVQGTLLPFVAKKLDMMDDTMDVRKTFTDYSDEVPIQYIQFTIPSGHGWVGCAVRNLLLPPDTLLVLLQRGGEKIIPNGDRILKAGDRLILTARAVFESEGIRLTEVCLTTGHEWIGKHLSKVALEPQKLVMFILRKGKIIIPNGSTVLMEQDILVINQA